jgi:hypothetical protein
VASDAARGAEPPRGVDVLALHLGRAAGNPGVEDQGDGRCRQRPAASRVVECARIPVRRHRGTPGGGVLIRTRLFRGLLADRKYQRIKGVVGSTA